MFRIPYENARMVDKTTEAKWFNWRLPVYATLVALAIFIAIEICPLDTSLFLYLFVVAPVLVVTSIYLLAAAAVSKNRPRYLRLMPTLFIFWATSTSFFVYGIKHPMAIRSVARWLVSASDYKEKVLAQPADPNGDLKHIEWDGWGMFGMDTTAFLVFDPSDALSAAAKSHQSGKFNGIPCEVYQVRRLESHWYTVVLFTGEDWGNCN